MRVVEVRDDVIIVDANHPLAGETLYFHVDVREVRDATEEELAHGHSHDGEGHGHERRERKTVAERRVARRNALGDRVPGDPADQVGSFSAIPIGLGPISTAVAGWARPLLGGWGTDAMRLKAVLLVLALAGCYNPSLSNPGFYCHPEDVPGLSRGTNVPRRALHRREHRRRRRRRGRRSATS